MPTQCKCLCARGRTCIRAEKKREKERCFRRELKSRKERENRKGTSARTLAHRASAKRARRGPSGVGSNELPSLTTLFKSSHSLLEAYLGDPLRKLHVRVREIRERASVHIASVRNRGRAMKALMKLRFDELTSGECNDYR